MSRREQVKAAAGCAGMALGSGLLTIAVVGGVVALLWWLA